MPGVTTRSRSTQPVAIPQKVQVEEEKLSNDVAQQKQLKRSRPRKAEPTGAVKRQRVSSEANEESDHLLSSTVCLAERVSSEAGTLRAEAVKRDREARALRAQVQELRTAVQMQMAKRERMEAFVVHWRKVARKMPYETLWGAQNGKMAMYKRADAPEPVEITSSDEDVL